MQHSFRVYVAGESHRSLQALSNLRAVCARHLGAAYHIEVIDVLIEPERAREQGVLATPAVIRVTPDPERRLVGDLADLDAVAATLGLAGGEPSPRTGTRS